MLLRETGNTKHRKTALVPALQCLWLSCHQNLRPICIDSQLQLKSHPEHNARRALSASGSGSVSMRWVSGCLWASVLGDMALGLCPGLSLTLALVTNLLSRAYTLPTGVRTGSLV